MAELKLKNGCATCDAVDKLTIEDAHLVGVALGLVLSGGRTPRETVERLCGRLCVSHAYEVHRTFLALEKALREATGA
jgi:hypothetical protein